LRRCSLIVSDTSGNGLDLSNLRVKFTVEQADLSTARPNTAIITVYNLADETVANVINEYSQSHPAGRISERQVRNHIPRDN
jgi:hypothetical protein